MGAGILVVLLLFFNSLLADLPQSALAAVVITAALSLVNLRAVRRYARVRPSSVVLSLVASLGVIAFGVLQGIVIAIFLAVLLFFRRNWWPHGAVLGHADGTEGCEAITDIDVTAAEMLEQLDEELNAAGRHLAFVELRGRLQDLVRRHGLFETLDHDHFYPSIDTAISAIGNDP